MPAYLFFHACARARTVEFIIVLPASSGSASESWNIDHFIVDIFGWISSGASVRSGKLKTRLLPSFSSVSGLVLYGSVLRVPLVVGNSS